VTSAAVSWLSSSSAEITRARHVLKSLIPTGVIDELGFLLLQGAFAEHFYPAVTTPMTRARYLVFVPAIYRHLEESGKARRKDADRLSRDLQHDLLRALLDSRERAIGIEGGRNIVRPPSSIYWNALAVLGCATRRVSEASYQRGLSEGLFGARVLRDDDGVAHDDDDESLWNAALSLSHVMPGGAFPQKTDFRLRKTEAEFLQAGYARVRPGGQHNLITHSVGLQTGRGTQGLEQIDYLWELPSLAEETADAAEHARKLSLFARGTTLQYHRMLIEKKKDEDTGAADAFGEWWKRAHSDMGSWDLEAFFALIRRLNVVPRSTDRSFFKDWIERCVSSRTSKAALDDTASRVLIAGREDRVRPGKQRLRVKYQLDAWGQPPYRADEIYLLRYRHQVGRVIAGDIAEGLRRGAA